MENQNTPSAQRTPWLVRTLAIAMSLFQLYTGLFQLTAMNQRVIHVTFALVLIFLLYGFDQKKNKSIAWHGYLMSGIVLLMGIYVLANWFKKIGAIGMSPPWYELVMGTVFILFCIEAARRTLGWIFPIIAVVAMVYARFGEMLPGFLAHRNYSFERIVSNMFITTDGVFGMLAGISATYIFLFILFGALLRAAGGGEFFINLSFALFGHVRGGPAKIAVVASSLFGMLSGSGTANVAGTGQITIPLMKRSGYKPHFAGAVETVSSAGGLLMPPIMGAGAFIMSQWTQIPYLTIVGVAIIPAMLYFISVAFFVHLRAKKQGLRTMGKDEIPPIWGVLKEGWHFFIPIGVLMGLLIYGFTPTFAACAGIGAIVVSSWFNKKTRMGFRDILDAFAQGARNMVSTGVILLCSGIVVGVVLMVGAGIKFSIMISTISGGSLFITIILVALASLVLGMGLPVTASYIVLAVLAAPSMEMLGASLIASHMLIFWYSQDLVLTSILVASVAGIVVLLSAITAVPAAHGNGTYVNLIGGMGWLSDTDVLRHHTALVKLKIISNRPSSLRMTKGCIRGR